LCPLLVEDKAKWLVRAKTVTYFWIPQKAENFPNWENFQLLNKDYSLWYYYNIIITIYLKRVLLGGARRNQNRINSRSACFGSQSFAFLITRELFNDTVNNIPHRRFILLFAVCKLENKIVHLDTDSNQGHPNEAKTVNNATAYDVHFVVLSKGISS
jgi:hypothetical protein